MNLPSLSINRPVLAIVMSLLIILFGGIGFNFLGVREYPSIDPPVITVRTGYAGANADVVESQITEPLEKAINGIAGIRTISSASNLGNSVITVEFDLEVGLEAAANDVRDKVSQAVRNLPQDIDALPTVTKSDANSDAIISLTVQSDTRNVLELSDFAENVIAERLQTIPGVSTIQIWGQKRYAMRLWLDPARLASFRLTPLDVRNALEKENVDLPGGKVVGNSSELTVKTIGRLTSEDEFNDLIIKSEGNNIIRLKDVGYATLGPENEETILKNNGIPMIACAIVPQPGSNYIEIADEFYKRLEQIKKDIPSDLKVGIALDNTRFVRNSVKEVEETLLIAILLVVLIIFLFFRDWLIALRPLIDIPVSLIGAFFIMYLFGFSINVLTLLAIVLATGLVVDDGIVVTENIFKKVEKGMSPVEAAHKGSAEIFFVVISTSITLAAVFLPVIFMEGFVGRLFREFGIVLSGAVLISAFVSLTLTPMLNARLIRKNQKHSRFYEMTEPFFRKLDDNYRNSLEQFMKKRYRAWVILGLVTGMIFLFGGMLKKELAPLEDRNWFRLLVTAPEGASFEYTDKFMNSVADMIMDSVPERRICLTVTAPGFAGSGAVNTGFGRIVLTTPDERKRSQQEIVDQVSAFTRSFPAARTFVVQEQTLSAGGGPRGSLPVQFVIQNSDFEKLKAVIPVFMKEINSNPVFQGSDVNLKFNKPELQVSIDREKARMLGVSMLDVAQTLQLAFSGQRFAYFQRQGKQYQVIGQFDRANRDEPTDLRMIYLRNDKGELVQLDNVVKLEEQSSPPQLYHYNRFKAATLSAGLAPGSTIGDGVEAMNRIAEKVLDESFSTELTGASRDYAESSSNALYAFMLALVIIYLILAAQFESFIDPFIIMLTVPLALGGAVFSLWYFNLTLNIFSQIGMIMLIGLVTKNGIMIVEFANKIRESGKSKMEAILEASALRLRPILMTSLATMLGALPIALALGAGARSRIPLGVVIIGGLLFALILTLYVIPVIYTYLSRKKMCQIARNYIL
ncbi:MAG: efflux RND transporter permease subunit [Bacteroidetes bacterium]|nr:efflux RND transporter permease subunit [Bacteroidota bacterium]